MRWTVLIPLKALPAAKSRLGATLDPVQHAKVVDAIRADTLTAARAAANVARVVVVTDRPGAFDADAVFVQRTAGLNGGLDEAAADAALRWPQDGIAALVGDLPALVAGDLEEALTAASGHSCSFVADSAGTGTTLLAVRPGTPLAPAFGEGSAARHRAAGLELAAGATLRADVDTQDDLEAARALGVGPRTRAVLEVDADISRSPGPGMMSS